MMLSDQRVVKHDAARREKIVRPSGCLTKMLKKPHGTILPASPLPRRNRAFTRLMQTTMPDHGTGGNFHFPGPPIPARLAHAMTASFSRPELPAMGIVASLASEDRAMLSHYGEFLPVQPDQTIIRQGEEQDSLYFLISGILHVQAESDGRTALVGRVEAGETLGEVNIFDPAAASATVIAKSFAQIWRASRTDIDAFVATYPEAGAKLLSGILACMSRRLRRMNQRLSGQQAMADIHGLTQ
jgi:CRP-like cAMP-binding protein